MHPRDFLAPVGRALAARDPQAWFTTFLLVLPLYLLTAHYHVGSVDTQSSVWPAWQFVHHGNLYMDGFRHPPYWSVLVGHHLVSNRMPATVLVNLPAALLLYVTGPTLAIGAITAAIMTAATIATMFLVFRQLASLRTAAVAAALAATGTGLWTVASTELWTHTVDALCLAAAAYMLSRERPWLAGLAFGCAITARPQIAVVAAVVGIGLGWSKRAWRPMFAIAVPSLVGLVGVVGWNAMVFGHPSISGTYGSYAAHNLTTLGAADQALGGSGAPTFIAGLVQMVSNLVGFLFSPQRGLLVFTPLALLLAFGVRSAWREAPAWARIMAVGGLAYTLVQLRINSFAGGDAFYGYRLAIELVVCAAPLGVTSFRSWVCREPSRRQLARVFSVASVALQAAGAFLFNVKHSSASDPWHASPLVDALRSHPSAGFLLLVFSVVAGALHARGVTLEHDPHRANRSGDSRVSRRMPSPTLLAVTTLLAGPVIIVGIQSVTLLGTAHHVHL